ncbi:MAG: glycosyltransferase family 39 protein [Sedimentisphaerales bacterium]
MLNEAQHPGYPWLIIMVYKVTSFLCKNTSVFSWIYCAQSVTLLSRLITIAILYYIGKKLSGSWLSFWAILIFIVLPKPAEYGSDVLSDWPHLCFLTAGLLLILNGASNKRFWLFGFAGLASGMGYLIRPECVQLIVLGSLWLGLQLVWHKRIINRGKALCAICLLIAGFLVTAGPYMKLKGSIFPKKNVDLFTQEFRQIEISEKSNRIMFASQFAGSDIPKAFGKLGQNIGETLMWFFVPALLIGMHTWFKTRKWYETETFLAGALIILNVFLMVCLYCRYRYMSYRHILPLLILLVFYVPIGLQELAIWFRHIFSRDADSISVTGRNEKFWFLILFFIGFFVCVPKLFMPIRMEKQGHRATAKWLGANTDNTDIVAVPDIRIAFYAQREGVVYEKDDIPSNAVYVVRIISKNAQNETALTWLLGDVVYEYINKGGESINVIIRRK